MKKLLLASTVMLFLCSVSFAQAKKNSAFSKEAKEAKQKEQDELDKNKIAPIAATPEPKQEVKQKSVLQKSDLVKPSKKSNFIIEPEQEAPKAAVPGYKKNTSN